MVSQQYRSRKLKNSSPLRPNGEAGFPASPLRILWGRIQHISFRFSGILLIAFPVIIIAALVLYPLLAIIIQSVFPGLFSINPDTTFTLNILRSVFTDPLNYKAITTSITLSLITSIGSGIVGITLAIIARRTTLPGRSLIDPFVWLIFFTPTFLLGEAWTILMYRGGTIDHFIHLPQPLITSFFSLKGVAFILILKSFPFVYFAVTAALIWLGSEFEDAARIGGAGTFIAWLRINIPLLTPSILSGAIIVFAETLSDYGTAATIAQNSQLTLITYQIYQAIGTFPIDFAQAAALSLLLFAAIIIALIGQRRLVNTKAYQIISGRTRPARPIELGYWNWLAGAFVIVILFLAFLLPLAEMMLLSFQHSFSNGISSSNLTLNNYSRAFETSSGDREALFMTIRISIATATLVTLIGLPIAYIIQKTTIPGRNMLSFVTLVTISIPGIILASGYIFAWNSPYLQNIGIGGHGEPHFYNTIWILLAAFVAGALPYSIRLNIGGLNQISNTVLEAARVQGAGIFSILVKIIIPIMQSGLVSIWLLVFTGTMFELAAAQLLYPAGEPTMSVQIVHYFSNSRIELGMALAMVNIAIVGGIVMVLRGIPLIWNWAQQTRAKTGQNRIAREGQK